MNYYYITGTSRGLGKSFAEYLLKDASNIVIGISRTQSIQHKNYKHIVMDLSDIEKVKSFQFEMFTNVKKVYLINNSGVLGMVEYVGKQNPQNIIDTYNVNLVSPALLTNNFIKMYQDYTCEKVIVNISSGAGKNSFDGWSIYCSTKAGLDMHSRVVNDEQSLISDNKIEIYSIAPGVVDTQMQQEIRQVSVENFSRKDDFLNYKKTDSLLDPDLVATKLFRILDHRDEIKNTVFSLRDIS